MEKKYATVAVIGRPNVGKSTLFNRLVKERKAIVDDMPGVTRDRLYAEIEWNGKGITLIDTGGLVFNSQDLKDEITSSVKKHVFSAIEQSDFLIFLVDGISGVHPDDKKIASELRKIKDKIKIFLAVNKIDTEKQLYLINDFYSLGLNEPYPISALSGSSGLADILDEIANSSGEIKINEDKAIKIAIVGKPNVGKSSILNCLVQEERAIVTSQAGTTRDSVDSKITINEQDYILIDTAGLRRKSKVSSKVERYATTRAISSIERADVVLLVVEATSHISDQDQKIASLIKKREKASIILVNKWDLVKNKDSNTINLYENDILTALRFIDYSKILFTSAIERKNVNKIWNIVNEAYENYTKRVSTGKLNKIFEDIVLLSSPPSKNGKQFRIYYVTQAGVKPPEIVLFVNDSELAGAQYLRFLEKEFRRAYDFQGSAIKFVLRNKRKK